MVQLTIKGKEIKTTSLEYKEMRTLQEIALDIKEHWKKPYFGAVPYIDAMMDLNKMSEFYGADPADHIVRYFLGNAHTWRGPDARRIKAELNEMLDD